MAKEDKEAEMTVVRNEFERGENDPYSLLDKEIWAAPILLIGTDARAQDKPETTSIEASPGINRFFLMGRYSRNRSF